MTRPWSRARRWAATGPPARPPCSGPLWRPRQLKKNTPALPNIQPWAEQEALEYEKEALGFYITGHPLDRFIKDIKRLSSYDTASLAEISDKSRVTLAGLPVEIKETLDKKGNRMAFVKLEDLKGSVELLVVFQVLRRMFRGPENPSSRSWCRALWKRMNGARRSSPIR